MVGTIWTAVAPFPMTPTRLGTSLARLRRTAPGRRRRIRSPASTLQTEPQQILLEQIVRLQTEPQQILLGHSPTVRFRRQRIARQRSHPDPHVVQRDQIDAQEQELQDLGADEADLATQILMLFIVRKTLTKNKTLEWTPSSFARSSFNCCFTTAEWTAKGLVEGLLGAMRQRKEGQHGVVAVDHLLCRGNHEEGRTNTSLKEHQGRQPQLEINEAYPNRLKIKWGLNAADHGDVSGDIVKVT